jgi:hypothetical protein
VLQEQPRPRTIDILRGSRACQTAGELNYSRLFCPETLPCPKTFAPDETELLQIRMPKSVVRPTQKELFVSTVFLNVRISDLPGGGRGNRELSPQLRIVGLGLLQDGDVGVGVFPEREKVIVSGAALDAITR